MLTFSFIWLVLGSYSAANIYLLFRLWSALAGTGAVRVISCGLLLALAVSFPVSRFLYSRLPHSVAHHLALIGTAYLAPMTYAALLALAADLLRALRIRPLSPTAAIWSIIVLVAIISAYGAWNAFSTVARFHEIEGVRGSRRLRVAMVSDIHVGAAVGLDHLERICALISQSSPDIVLMPGDVFDSTEWADDPAKTARAEKIFRSMEPRLGTWAVTGNHEFYAGAERCVELLRGFGVTVLRDEWRSAGDEAIVIGREDMTSIRRFGSADRRSLFEIAYGDAFDRLKESVPILVMDHQPLALQEAASFGADLQVSGHTHNGQLWPFGYVVSAMFECPYGLYKKDETHYYISSGGGIWGPPVRTSGRSEIAVIDLIPRGDHDGQ